MFFIVKSIFTYANGSRGLGFPRRLAVFCLSVFPHDISKTDVARITKRDMAMFHDDSRKSIYSGVERSKGKVTSHKFKRIACMLVARLVA